jgi:hypothetical protein
MRVGQARKRDANEPQIVAALEQVGARVRRISERGFCDLVVFHRHVGVVLLEVKSARGKLTAAQVEHRDDGWPVVIVRDVSDALRAVQIAPQ